jgi:hypothetical protein
VERGEEIIVDARSDSKRLPIKEIETREVFNYNNFDLILKEFAAELYTDLLKNELYGSSSFYLISLFARFGRFWRLSTLLTLLGFILRECSEYSAKTSFTSLIIWSTASL